jgi:release factor glutamine methyltransferase
MTVREALAAAAARLAAVSDTARLDAELLMAHALGVEREALLLASLDGPAPATFEPLVLRRLAHEPIAYITGIRGFWTIELEVGPGVLIPRPDSETLLEAAVAHFGKAGPRTILDLGTGSGALLLAALDQWPEARGVGLEKSREAIRIARRNVRRLGMRHRARIGPGDWSGVSGEVFDLILCNPPYVADSDPLPPTVALWEPHEALFSGREGVDDYQMIAPMLKPQLAPGGIACIEIGATQAARAGALFEAEGFQVSVRKDLAGRDRCLVLRH